MFAGFLETYNENNTPEAIIERKYCLYFLYTMILIRKI